MSADRRRRAAPVLVLHAGIEPAVRNDLQLIRRVGRHTVLEIERRRLVVGWSVSVAVGPAPALVLQPRGVQEKGRGGLPDRAFDRDGAGLKPKGAARQREDRRKGVEAALLVGLCGHDLPVLEVNAGPDDPAVDHENAGLSPEVQELDDVQDLDRLQVAAEYARLGTRRRRLKERLQLGDEGMDLSHVRCPAGGLCQESRGALGQAELPERGLVHLGQEHDGGRLAAARDAKLAQELEPASVRSPGLGDDEVERKPRVAGKGLGGAVHQLDLVAATFQLGGEIALAVRVRVGAEVRGSRFGCCAPGVPGRVERGASAAGGRGRAVLPEVGKIRSAPCASSPSAVKLLAGRGLSW